MVERATLDVDAEIDMLKQVIKRCREEIAQARWGLGAQKILLESYLKEGNQRCCSQCLQAIDDNCETLALSTADLVVSQITLRHLERNREYIRQMYEEYNEHGPLYFCQENGPMMKHFK